MFPASGDAGARRRARSEQR